MIFKLTATKPAPVNVCIIHFSMTSEVVVMGSFDNWKAFHPLKRTSLGHYASAEVQVSQTDKIIFKFIVDDIWTCSKDFETEIDNQGNMNNIAYFNAPAPPPKAQLAIVSTDVVLDAVLDIVLDVVLDPLLDVIEIAETVDRSQSPLPEITASEQESSESFKHPSTQIVIDGPLDVSHEPFHASYERPESELKGRAFALKFFEGGEVIMKEGLSPVEEEVEADVVVAIETADSIEIETKPEEPAQLITEDSHTTLRTDDEKSTAEFGSDFASQIVHTSKKSKTLLGKLNSWFGRKRSEVVHCEVDANGEIVEILHSEQVVEQTSEVVNVVVEVEKAEKVGMWATVRSTRYSLTISCVCGSKKSKPMP